MNYKRKAGAGKCRLLSMCAYSVPTLTNAAKRVSTGVRGVLSILRTFTD